MYWLGKQRTKNIVLYKGENMDVAHQLNVDC
jgi:hypothetical protein